jgi:hypothetical protein
MYSIETPPGPDRCLKLPFDGRLPAKLRSADAPHVILTDLILSRSILLVEYTADWALLLALIMSFCSLWPITMRFYNV